MTTLIKAPPAPRIRHVNTNCIPDQHPLLGPSNCPPRKPATAEQAARALIPIPEAREYLGGIGLTTLYDLIKSGELVKANIGRRGFVTWTSLQAYVERISGSNRP